MQSRNDYPALLRDSCRKGKGKSEILLPISSNGSSISRILNYRRICHVIEGHIVS